MSDSVSVDLHPLAAVEIEDADDWYSNIDSAVGERFRDAVYSALEKIGNNPLG